MFEFIRMSTNGFKIFVILTFRNHFAPKARKVKKKKENQKETCRKKRKNRHLQAKKSKDIKNAFPSKSISAIWHVNTFFVTINFV